MAEDRTARKLAVVLHADVVGSTALVRQNEQIAHERIQDAFQRLSKCITAYGGIPHELRGDALLAEFNRASDAVSAALAFQQSNARHNQALADHIAPVVRVGISLGEVVIADETLTGPDVVLAQRLEQLADPGGVCISVAVQQALPGRLPFELTDLGEQEIKGFDEPVRAYKVALKDGASIPVPELVKEAPTESRKLAWFRLAVGVAAPLVIIGGGLLWWQPWQPQEEPASVERMAFPLPDKPSIAVLPFSDLTDGSEHSYIASGLMENIIATLGKVPELFVVDRSAVARYDEDSIKVHQVSEELGVRYVLKGSVQKSREQLRVTATLIDATTGQHIWTERYDRDMSDLFAVQDEITARVVVELQVNLTEGEQARLKYDSTTNIEAWENQVRARQIFLQFTKADNTKARRLFERAVALDPDYAFAWTFLGWTHKVDADLGFSESREESLSKAEELASKALQLDPQLPEPLALLGSRHLRLGTALLALEVLAIPRDRLVVPPREVVSIPGEMEHSGTRVGLQAQRLVDQYHCFLWISNPHHQV
jgi:adenylate cyclase